MALVDPCSAECAKSELEIFDLPPTQTSIDETRVEKFFPLTSVDSSDQHEFRVNVGIDEMIDLNDIWVYTKNKILDDEGTAIPGAAAGQALADESMVFPVNYFNASQWRQVDIMVNSQSLPSATMYPYRGMFETLLSFDSEVKQNQLRAALWEEDVENMECKNTLAANEKNTGAKRRYERTKESTVFECLGRIHHELFEQPKLLLNKVTLGIKFHRNDAKFILMAKKVGESYRISTEKVILLVTVKKIASHVREAIESRLLETKAKYNLRRVEMKFFTKGSERADVSVTNLCTGVIPSQIILGLVETDSFNGNYQKNPYNFKHFGVTEMSLVKNGMNVPFKSLQLKFAGKNRETLLAYFQLMHSLGFWNKNKSNGIDPISMFPAGYTLYAVNLTQDMSNGGNLNLIQEGVIGLNLRLKEGIDKSITIVVYLVYPQSVLEIDHNREIFYNE